LSYQLSRTSAEIDIQLLAADTDSDRQVADGKEGSAEEAYAMAVAIALRWVIGESNVIPYLDGEIPAIDL
jgi:hypothetical protein